MIIENSIKIQIKLAALGSDREKCGIIVNDEVITLNNIHHDPENHFTIAANDLAMFDYGDISAIWHTHHKDNQPGYFTYTDIELAHQSQKPIILYHSGFDVWDYYEANNPDPFPLEKKPHTPQELDFYLNTRFHWGRSDCFAIVRRYLLGIVGIDIGEFTRTQLDNFPPEDYDCPWSMNKFNLLPLGTQPQLHDVFGVALKGGRKVNHAMIMVKPVENIILHSPSDSSVSKLEQYADYWRKRTLLHGRLKELC
jgi:hypothetical protein